jgi:hypothetical protein
MDIINARKIKAIDHQMPNTGTPLDPACAGGSISVRQTLMSHNRNLSEWADPRFASLDGPQSPYHCYLFGVE